ncbi:D-aminoacyl-tRNA deacylase 1-like isoform X2 [Actinia tenebrosa]|nr:D-aminoacyl-tRNA deacylase 1-like isoform X2 [Actinia tenebrosa]
MEYIVRKILNLRLFDDNGQRWKKSVMDKQYEVLCVSQFTLCSVLKGNKPDFHCAMGGEESEKFYQTFLEKMRTAYKPEAIKDGKFAAYMQVHIQNDGPVTINLESTPSSNNQQEKQNPGKKVKSSSEENGERENSVQEQTASNLTEQVKGLKLENMDSAS